MRLGYPLILNLEQTLDYLPRYSVIESPERWTEIVWESLRNRGTGLGENGAEYAQSKDV